MTASLPSPDISPCGCLLAEEPTGSLWAKNMSGHFEQYKQQYAAIKAMDPHPPIFILDCPWIPSPATEWWCARPLLLIGLGCLRSLVDESVETSVRHFLTSLWLDPDV